MSTDLEVRKDAMIAHYLSGKSAAQAGSLQGFSETVCLRELARRGIPRRTRHSYRKFPFNDRFFKVIDTEHKAYWLGFIAADGYVNPARDTLAITLARRDREHLIKFCNDLGRGAQLYDFENSGNDGIRRLASSITLRSSALLSDLTKHGVHTCKSFTAPAWHGPDDLMGHYWRGVIDGDGFISKQGKYWYIGACGSRNMMDALCSFMQSICHTKAKVTAHSSIFKWSTGGTECPQMVARRLYSGATIALERKNLLAQELIGLDLTPKPRVSPTYRADVSTKDVAFRYMSGETPKAIASAYGISIPTVYERLEILGINRCFVCGEPRGRKRQLQGAPPTCNICRALSK